MGLFRRKSSMPTFGEMPGDNADLASIQVDFPPLRNDSAESSPESVSALLQYLADEVPDGDQLAESDLHFVRTAQVADAEYWVWRFREPGADGQGAFLTVSRRGGQVCVGYETDYYGLTPEQYVLGDYHQVF